MQSFTATAWTAKSWFKFFAAVNWKRGFPLSSRTKDKDLTLTRCPIPRLPRTSAPTTGVESG